MSDLSNLLTEVRDARQRLLDAVQDISGETAQRKANPRDWSIAEIVEHLVLAEHAGIRRIWSAADAVATGDERPTPPSVNAGLSIEEVVARTWKPLETAPPNATPSGEGSFAYWLVCFRNCEPVLEALGRRLAGMDLAAIVFPHFLCGPLDARQRLEFLRFHIDRHREQAVRILAHGSR